jgi:hypothetical protein
VDNFDALRNLAAIDREVAQLRYNREHLPAVTEMQQIDATLKTLVAELHELEQVRGPLVAQRDDLEQQATTLRNRRSEIAKKLSTSTAGARELEALTTEVAHLGTSIDDLETAELGILETLEPLDESFHEIGRAAKVATERRTELVAMVAAAQSQLDDEIERALAPRATAVSELAASVADLYERILQRVHDVAAVDVIDGKCGGCKIAVVALDLGRWKSATADSPSSCPECSRLWIGPA